MGHIFVISGGTGKIALRNLKISLTRFPQKKDIIDLFPEIRNHEKKPHITSLSVLKQPFTNPIIISAKNHIIRINEIFKKLINSLFFRCHRQFDSLNPIASGVNHQAYPFNFSKKRFANYQLNSLVTIGSQNSVSSYQNTVIK